MTEPVDPDQLEKVEFSVVRRGVDPEAVRSTLAEAADGLRLLQRRCHELEHRIETLEGQVPSPEQIEMEREAARAEGQAAGEADGDHQREEARSEAEALVADAKEEGRQLVSEAQTVRRRMLEDLARRRRLLRQQIEQLRGGRERLLEAYEVVGHTMREATAELTAALPEARAAAERAGHGVGPQETVDQLEAEIEAARLAGLPIVTGQDPPDEQEDEPVGRRRPVPVPLERDVRDMPEIEPVVSDFEDVRILPDDEDETDSAEVQPPSGPDDGVADLSGRRAIEEQPVTEAAPDGDEGADEGDPEVEEPAGSGTVDADQSESDDDLFARLRRSRVEDEGETAVDESPVDEDVATGTDADARSAGDDAVSVEELDHPGDAAEPFGLVLGTEPEPAPAPAASDERATAEHELARRLKRLLSDEQNDVLDRLRRTRKRTLVMADLLGDFEERVTKFADAVEPVLADAVSAAAGPTAQPVDDFAAELAREVAGALSDGMVEPLEEKLPVEDMVGPVRALYRYWRTDRIGLVAERYVEAVCQPAQEPIP